MALLTNMDKTRIEKVRKFEMYSPLFGPIFNVTTITKSPNIDLSTYDVSISVSGPQPEQIERELLEEFDAVLASYRFSHFYCSGYYIVAQY